MLLLNDLEGIFSGIPIGKYMEKRRYKQAVSECKKWRSLIQIVVGRNITNLSK